MFYHLEYSLLLHSFVAVAAATFCVLILVAMTPFAERLRLLDVPGDRKRHRDPTPTIGGLVIYICILTSVILLDPDPKLSWMMAAVSVLVVTGAFDDAFGLSIKIRFFAQILGSIVMMLGSQLYLKSIDIGFEFFDSFPVWFAALITVFAIVGLTNGFNMADGIDGLAAGHTLIGLAIIAATSVLTTGMIPELGWFVALCSVVFVFFLVNINLTPLKQVFLGDAGSMLLGFVMGWTLIYYSQEPIGAIHPVAALWCVAIPVCDTVLVIIHRLRNSDSPFASDRKHLHHLLVDRGLTPLIAMVMILSSSFFVSSFGVLLTYLSKPILSLLLFGGLLVAFGCGVWSRAGR